MPIMGDSAKQAMEVISESHAQQSSAFSIMRGQIELMSGCDHIRKLMEKEPQFQRSPQTRGLSAVAPGLPDSQGAPPAG